MTKISDKQKMTLLKVNCMWEGATSAVIFSEGAIVSLQQAASEWDDDEELSVGCGHLLT